jgi:CPA1 family monovalent cation:H+ antiporter
MELVLIGILTVVVIAVSTAVAPRVGIAGPLVLVVIGLGVSLLPFVDIGEVDPEIILIGVLPPLLYSAAVSLPAIEFRRDFSPIVGLSVVLVVLSSVALGAFFFAAIPGLGIPLALALGAILSPTDAVATGIAKRLGISRRVVTVLEGESLLNDATSLVILRAAVTAFIVGGLSVGEVALAFVSGVLVAIVVGAIVGYATLRFRAWLRHPAANTAIGFIVPFVAYLPTERLGGSGLVAAVVAGIVMGQGSARWSTPEQRLSDALNWRTIELVLEGGVFLIMGLQLKEIVRQNFADHEGVGQAAALALVALVIVLLVRTGYVAFIVWLQGRRARGNRRRRLEAYRARIDRIEASSATRGGGPRGRGRRIESMRGQIDRAFADLDYYQASPLGWRHGTIIVWAGMRGVVTLAAAQTLPHETPARPLLILVAFLVAVGSLMLQGFTLPWLVRALGLAGTSRSEMDDVEQKRLDAELRDAAASALSRNEVTRRDGSAFPPKIVDAVSTRMAPPVDDETTALARDLLELRLAVIAVMRARLTDLSTGGIYGSEPLRRTLAELDADQLSIELRLDQGD